MSKRRTEAAWRGLGAALRHSTIALLLCALPACLHEVATEEVYDLEADDEAAVKEQEITTASNVQKAIDYGLSIVGTPYGWWYSGPVPQSAPMWAKGSPPPSVSTVRANSVNCAGLTNLMLRAIGKEIPHAPGIYSGGTLAYGEYYANKAQPFSANKSYPAGTLLGRYFRGGVDQGHVAVVLGNGKVLQSFAYEYGGAWPGVNTTYTVAESHDGGFYEYVVYPKDWLGGSPPPPPPPPPPPSSGSGSGSGSGAGSGSTDGSTTTAPLIIDSNNANNDTNKGYVEASSSWAAGYSDGYYGTGYYWASVQPVSDAVAFHFYVPQAGSRTIDARWVAGANRSSATPFLIVNAAGQQVGKVKRDQRINGGKWRSLGSFPLTKGWNKVLVSRWAADGDVVVADAVRVR